MKSSPVRTALRLLGAAGIMAAGAAAGWHGSGAGKAGASRTGTDECDAVPAAGAGTPSGNRRPGGSAAKSTGLSELMRMAQGGGSRWVRLHRVLEAVSRLTPEEARAIMENPLQAFAQDEAQELNRLFGMESAGVFTLPLLVMARWQQQDDAGFRAWCAGLERGGYLNLMPYFADLAILWEPARHRPLSQADLAGFSEDRLAGVLGTGGMLGPAFFPVLAATLRTRPDAADPDPDITAALFSGTFDTARFLELAEALPGRLRRPVRAGILDAMARTSPEERLALPLVRAEDLSTTAGRAGIANEMARRGLALAQLALSDAARAASLTNHAMEASAAIHELAERDESSAARWVQTLTPDLRRRLASGRDPAEWPASVREALLRSFPADDAPAEIIAARAAEMARLSPEAIRSALNATAGAEARKLAEAVLAEHAAVSPATAAALARDIGHPEAIISDRVLAAMAPHDPQAVLDILAGQENPRPEPELFLHLGRADPAGTLSWLTKNPSIAASPLLAAETMHSWAHESPAAAGEWINRSLRPGPVRDGAARGLALALADEDPEAARVWAASISDRGLREITAADLETRAPEATAPAH